MFWFGDLNFRLIGEEEFSHNDIKRLVEQDRLDELIQRDQLSMIRRQGRAFTRLEERLPAFPPTFKFEHGTSDYDTKLVWLQIMPTCSAIFESFDCHLSNYFHLILLSSQTTTSLV